MLEAGSYLFRGINEELRLHQNTSKLIIGNKRSSKGITKNHRLSAKTDAVAIASQLQSPNLILPALG
ncbi:hypothetical protein KSP40_PGU020888 [Platanthera guangdongensis]|uniref:Uncharacterized protein n=1 Tax=Platanthera guangdongensis TaxID=2320717 RepID=A0ABR2LN70_9ASPA